MGNENNSLKTIGQFLAALVYTTIYSALLFIVVFFSLYWLLTLPAWAILLILFLGATFILKVVNVFAMMPYFWIVKNNLTAAWTSIIILVGISLYNVIFCWQACLGHGRRAIILAVAFTIIFIGVVFADINMILTTAYDESE